MRPVAHPLHARTPCIHAPLVCMQGRILCSGSMAYPHVDTHPPVALLLLRSGSASLWKGCSLYRLASSQRCVLLVQHHVANPACICCSEVTVQRSGHDRLLLCRSAMTLKETMRIGLHNHRALYQSGGRKRGSKQLLLHLYFASTLAWIPLMSSKSLPAPDWNAGWTHCQCSLPKLWTPLVAYS